MGKCANVCDCNITVANLGVACTPNMKVIKRPWIVNEHDAAGDLNYIDLTSDLDDDYFQELINAADPLARWCPLPEVKNIADNRDKPVVYAFKDGDERFVRDGVRKFEGTFPPESASPQLTGKIEAWRCAQPCFMGVDADGTFWGKISADGTKLYPVKMAAGSIAPIFTKPTDTEPQMLGISFNFHTSEKDCVLRGLPADELDGVNPLDYDGLLDVYLKVISCDTTKLVAKLYTEFGTTLNPLTDKGLVVGDFALYNKTDDSAIALTGAGADFSESLGIYTLTFATDDQPTAADILRLTPTKNGRDYTAVVATDIVVS